MLSRDCCPRGIGFSPLRRSGFLQRAYLCSRERPAQRHADVADIERPGGQGKEAPCEREHAERVVPEGNADDEERGAGEILLTSLPAMRKAGATALLGVSCIAAGLLWGIWFPIIHHLWTSSLVLYAGGWSCLLLALFYLVIDVWGYRKWAFFFVVIGMNAITIYFLQSIVHFDEIAKLFVQGIHDHSGVLQPLVLPLGGLALKWLLLWFLYRHRIFFRL